MCSRLLVDDSQLKRSHLPSLDNLRIRHYTMSSNYRRLSQSYASTRVSLRWLPEPPFENTETLVLTVGEWYVDLRVDKGSGALDWAIAGECTVKDVNPRMYRLLLFRLSYSVCLINCFDRAHCLHTHN
jgi:hypothetical protein